MSATWRTARLGFISVGILLLIFAAAAAVLAVRQDDPFELDSNAVDDPGGGVDWANVYAPQTNAAQEHQRFVADVSGPNADTIFTQGGSKDVSDIAEWRHTTGNVPDKDDLLNAYAAAYSIDGTLTLYFGADRFANDGDAQIGVWFFQNRVELLPDGTFSGAHTSGDTLILSNFIGGGDASHIQIYRWNGQADPSNPLLLVAEASAEGALSVCTEGDLACAFTNPNPGGEVAPWPYAAKSGEVGIFPAVSFFEGGIDISAVLGENALGCYSTFLVETRSSQEPTAQLKDFIAGSLDLCGLTASLTANELSKVTDPVTYTLTLENTGLVTLYAQSIQDAVLGDLSSQASGAGCTVLAPGAVCQFTVTYIVQPGDPDPLINAISAVYQAGSGDVVTAVAEQSINLFQPSITFANVGSAASAAVGDQVSYTLTLANTSSTDSPNLTCTISDPMLSVEESVNLAPTGQHSFTVTYIVPAADSGNLVNSASVRCQVDGFPNILEAASDFTLAIVTAPAPASTPTPTDTPVPTEVPPTATFTFTPEPPPSEESGPVADENQPAPTITPTATATPEPQGSPEPEVTQEAANAPVGEGCSPGFWQGGHGRWLWNEANDPDWLGVGSNPFTHSTQFNSFFAPYEATAGYTMYDFVRGGGGSNAWKKAARNVVAGYLNAWYGIDYPFTPAEIAQMWSDAVSGARSFIEVHEILGAANTLGCAID